MHNYATRGEMEMTKNKSMTKVWDRRFKRTLKAAAHILATGDLGSLFIGVSNLRV